MTAYVPGITETDLKKIILALQQLAAGQSNAVGRVTLATGTSSTVVADNNCSAGATPILTATAAAAAPELGNGTIYVSAVSNGPFTLTHASSAAATRTFMHCSAELACVDPGQVGLVWPLVAPRLRRAILRTGLSAFADVERDVLDGRALLWLALSQEGDIVAIDAVATTRLERTDAGKVCVIDACKRRGDTIGSR